jgi:protein involved in polysaccharide export with SLBB domain
MRIKRHACRFFPGARYCLIVVVAALASNPRFLHAQSPCADGSDPDTLGCAAQQASTQQSISSPSTPSVEERPLNDTPSADRSSEASAKGSLPGGASYTEGATRNGRRELEPRSVAPEPPNEFQTFVAATSGQMLPVYGARLFNTQPAFFGPIDHGPAPGELIIGPDDELRIRIWGQVNFSANLRVSREGEIYLPKVGAVHVAGMPFSAIPAHLRSVMERVYRNFELSVDLGDIHTIQIYVTGMAHQPGEYTISALNTLVDAVFAVGGPSASGSMRHVQLKRAGKVVTDFDLYALLVSGDKSGDMQLQPADVLYIPVAGPQVALMGSVSEPAIYEMRGEETIDQLLDTAGGRTVIASGARLSVDRIEDRARRRAFAVAADQAGLATLLAGGDIVRVDPIVSDYRDAVTLRGAVANPGRFQWHPGMRLSELMPERDALLRRDYWWKRTRLGLPAPQLAISPGSGNQSNGAANQTNLVSGSQIEGVQSNVVSITDSTNTASASARPESLESPAAQTNWNQAVIERLDPATMTTQLLPFQLGKLVLEHDISQDLELRPGDVITIFAQQDIQLPIQEQTVYLELSGEFVHPGIYSVSARDTLRSVVARAGGLTERAYLYGSTYTRKSTRALEQQQLNEYVDRLDHQMQRNRLALANAGSASGQQSSPPSGQQIDSVDREMIARIRQVRSAGRIVLKMSPGSIGLDALPDMRIEDGDELVVPFAPETIQVVGAVFNPHAFLYGNHARVEEYLHLAGGPSREADRRHMFVLRADGSVVGRDMGKSLFEADLSKLRLYPGDAIVVPEKDVRPSGLNQLMLWTQFLSQLSLNAVEFSVLK